MGLYREELNDVYDKIDDLIGDKDINYNIKDDYLYINSISIPVYQITKINIHVGNYKTYHTKYNVEEYDALKGYLIYKLSDNPILGMLGTKNRYKKKKDIKLIKIVFNISYKVNNQTNIQEFITGIFLKDDKESVKDCFDYTNDLIKEIKEDIDIYKKETLKDIMEINMDEYITRKEFNQIVKRIEKIEQQLPSTIILDINEGLILKAGCYKEGRDYDVGVYDIIVIEGYGDFSIDGDIIEFDSEDNTRDSYSNLELRQNSQIKIEEGLIVKLIRKE